jgi:hypothetical protein
MNGLKSIGRWMALGATALALTGCCVSPWGIHGGRGRHHVVDVDGHGGKAPPSGRWSRDERRH